MLTIASDSEDASAASEFRNSSDITMDGSGNATVFATPLTSIHMVAPNQK